MYTAVAPQRAILAACYPYLQVKREQVAAALEFLAKSARTEREEKIKLGERVTALGPKHQKAYAVDHSCLSPSYVAGLVRGVGSLLYHDGGIRFTSGAFLSPLFVACWESCPAFRETPPLTKRGEMHLASQDAYSFLTMILEHMPAEDPRAQQARILVEIYEDLSAPRWAPLNATDREKRELLVKKLSELKRT